MRELIAGAMLVPDRTYPYLSSHYCNSRPSVGCKWFGWTTGGRAFTCILQEVWNASGSDAVVSVAAMVSLRKLRNGVPQLWHNCLGADEPEPQ